MPIAPVGSLEGPGEWHCSISGSDEFSFHRLPAAISDFGVISETDDNEIFLYSCLFSGVRFM